MIYLDNPATTFPKPKEVYDFADKFYRSNGVYHSRGNYPAAYKVNFLVSETRCLILKLFNADENYQTIFSFSATMALNTILNGYPFKKKMNVYISNFEHNAVIRPLYKLKRIYDFNIEKLFCLKQGISYDIQEIKNQFEKNKPDVVIINHASNVCGAIAPIEEIFNLSKQYGSVNILDASQTAGLIEINLKRIKSDFTVFAGHKTLYAPFGIAGFVMNSSMQIESLILGGTGHNSANIEMPKEYPERLEAGSLDLYAIAGLNASLKWILRTGIKTIYQKEMSIFKYAENCLKHLTFINMIVTNYNKCGIMSFNVKNFNPDEIGKILSNHNIAVRTGLHCSPDAHRFLGTFPTGTVRIGFSYFNSKDDINALCEVLKEIY